MRALPLILGLGLAASVGAGSPCAVECASARGPAADGSFQFKCTVTNRALRFDSAALIFQAPTHRRARCIRLGGAKDGALELRCALPPEAARDGEWELVELDFGVGIVGVAHFTTRELRDRGLKVSVAVGEDL